jgi:hypothetical protein
MADNLEAQQYRALLVQTWQKTQDDIDKAILSLSGGALGVSFVFLKDIVGPAGAHKCFRKTDQDSGRRNCWRRSAILPFL